MNEYLEGWQNGFDDGQREVLQTVLDIIQKCKVNNEYAPVPTINSAEWNAAIGFVSNKIMKRFYSKPIPYDDDALQELVDVTKGQGLYGMKDYYREEC